MSLSERLADPPPYAIPVKCLTCKALEQMDPDESEHVQEAIHGHRWTDRALADLLAQEGYDYVTVGSLKNHRQVAHQ